MTTEETPTIPARLITPGDHFWGYVVSQTRNVWDGSREFKLVMPITTHSQMITIREQDLDFVTYPVTKRGDDYSPNARNAALGLPPVPLQVYVKPDAIASYPVGTKVKDIKHFDRSMKVAFVCPDHPASAWVSKDPFSSSIFPQFSDGFDDCQPGCKIALGDYVVTHEYLPTRNG